jgi:hypothetical protein
MGASRYPQPEGQAVTYWRRRFLALVGGLAVLALIAWAFSGSLGGGSAAHTVADDGGSQGGQAAHQSGPGAGGSGPGAAPARSAPPSASASASASDDRAGPTGSPAAGSSASPAGSGGAGAGKLSRCHHSDVVLSLSASQDSFSSRELPVFDVDVVSTSASTCTFNVGAKHVMLVIKAGTVRIWGSADCVEGQGSLITELESGVPTVLPIAWDRQTSSPGCQTASSQVPAGTYSATAVDGADVSNSVTVRLG